MHGFVGCMKLFPIMARVLVRHKQLRRKQMTLMQRLDVAQTQAELAFADEAEAELAQYLSERPPLLCGKYSDNTSEDQKAVFGMASANIDITAISVKMAIVRAFKWSLECTEGDD